jgi:hypothetical protein
MLGLCKQENADKVTKYLKGEKAHFPRLSNSQCEKQMTKDLVTIWWMCCGYPEDFPMKRSADVVKSLIGPVVFPGRL